MTGQLVKPVLDGFREALRHASVPTPVEISLGDLRKRDADWSAWEQKSGVYYFVQDGPLVYVGRALSGTGLGSRIHNQITSFGDPAWDAVIKDDHVLVGLICLPEKDWFLASSLEVFLIQRLRPRFNKRSQ